MASSDLSDPTSTAATGSSVPEIDGSTLVARSLHHHNVRRVFGVVGIPVTSIATRLVSLGVRFLAFHNEQSASYAAAIHSYLTSAPSVSLSVSGPGLVHALAGLSHAQTNALPLLLLSGSCDQSLTGLGDFQELDQLSAAAPFSKLTLKATHITLIPQLVSQALAATVAGRPGSVYLDLPSDVLHQTLPLPDADRLLSLSLPPDVPRSLPAASDIRRAVELLRAASRPLVVVGKGAAFARAEAEIRALVETTGIPFLPTPMGKGVVDDRHELSANAARSLAIAKCDVALVVGARLNWMLHFGKPPRWGKDVKFVLVDVCAEEVELRKPCVGLVGDAKEVVGLLNRAIKDEPFCLGRRHPWVEEIGRKARENVARMEERLAREVVPFDFFTPMRIIRDAILREGTPEPILVTEGANTMDVGRAVLVQTEPRTRLDAGTWGTMGIGMGYCVAAAVACPERLVVAVEGDSGFTFSAMEVETIIRYQLPVVVIVFNNGGIYGGDRRSPDEIVGPHKDDPAPTSFVPDAAYHRMMEAFGGKGYLAATPEELKSALTESFAARKPALINVKIDPYAGVESGRMQHKN